MCTNNLYIINESYITDKIQVDVIDVYALFLSRTIYIETFLNLSQHLSGQYKSVDLSKEPHPNNERGDHQGKRVDQKGDCK